MDIGMLANILTIAVSVIAIGAAIIAASRFIRQRLPGHSQDADVANRLLVFLSDKRVLFAVDYHRSLELESPQYAAKSVLHIRERLVSDMEGLNRSSLLAKSTQAMRDACAAFLDSMQSQPQRASQIVLGRGVEYDNPDDIAFVDALVALRAAFQAEISRLADYYKLPFQFSE